MWAICLSSKIINIVCKTNKLGLLMLPQRQIPTHIQGAKESLVTYD